MDREWEVTQVEEETDMALQKIYEAVCDFCPCVILHHFTKEQAMRDLRDAGNVVKGKLICDECREANGRKED